MDTSYLESLIPSSKCNILLDGYMRETEELFFENILIPRGVNQICLQYFGRNMFLANWYHYEDEDEEEEEWESYDEIDQIALNEAYKNNKKQCNVMNDEYKVVFHKNKQYKINDINNNNNDDDRYCMDIIFESKEEDAICVIDNGSYSMKVGFAGHDRPSSIFQTNNYKEIELKEYPIKNGIITSWSDMERIWHHSFYNELKICPEQHPVLLTESVLNSKSNREKITEIMFESFEVPAMYIYNQSVLSLYATGQTTGMVIDCGGGICDIVPIYQGYPLKHAVGKLNIAGMDISDNLYQILSEKGYSFKTTQIVNDIKEKLCYVALDYEEEFELKKNKTTNYQLPDGKIIKMNCELFECTEILFKPSIIGKKSVGIDKLAFDSMMKCDIDIRNDLYSYIVLCGGTTMLSGICNRLHREITNLSSNKYKVNIIQPSIRKYCAWIGGSILSELSTFQEMWILKDEYDESGPAIINPRGRF